MFNSTALPNIIDSRLLLCLELRGYFYLLFLDDPKALWDVNMTLISHLPWNIVQFLILCMLMFWTSVLNTIHFKDYLMMVEINYMDKGKHLVDSVLLCNLRKTSFSLSPKDM